MSRKVFVTLIAAYVAFASTQALAWCGATIAAPMLQSSVYRSGVPYEKYTQSTDAFQRAFNRHPARPQSAAAAAIAFESVGRGLSEGQRIDLFQHIVDIAVDERRGSDPRTYWDFFPDDVRSRYETSLQIFRDGRRQAELVGGLGQRNDEDVSPANARIDQVLRDLMVVERLPESGTGAIAKILARRQAAADEGTTLIVTDKEAAAVGAAAKLARAEIREISAALGLSTTDAWSIRSELAMSPSVYLDGDVRITANAVVNKRFDEARAQLLAIGYTPPEQNSAGEWNRVLARFQADQLTAVKSTGLLDRSTRERLQTLATEVDGAKELPLTRESWALITGSEDRPAVFPEGLDTQIRLFQVPAALADHISTTFNKAVGREVVGLRATSAESGMVTLAVLDSRDMNLSDPIKAIIRNDKIGVGLARANGVSVYATTLNGKTLVQTADGASSELELVEPSRFSAFTRLLLGKRRGGGVANDLSLRAKLSKKLRGKDVVVIQGRDLARIPVEALTDARVFRSAVEDRSPEEIASRAERAMNRPLTRKNTVYVQGSPETPADHAVLASMTGLAGDYETTWAPSVPNMNSALDKVAVRSQSKNIAALLRKELSKRDNVIVVVAHSSGDTLYFARKGKLQKVSIKELQSARDAIRENAPTVLMLSCKTAPDANTTGGSGQTLGRALIELGAGFVIAPTRDITQFEVEDLLARIASGPGNETLVEAVDRALDESGLAGKDPTVKMYVDNKN